jgi:DNA ligase-1
MPHAIEVRYDRGIYLPEADLWLDPAFGKERAFVSHAHSDHFARHRWTLCSRVTEMLSRSRYGNSALATVVAPDWKERVVERGFEFRLLPAGHILGSAMLHVTRLSDGATLLYTGDFKLREGLSSERAELMKADTLILETTFGLPMYRFPPVDEVIGKVIAFVQETIEDGGIPVLLGYSLGKAQEVLAALNGAGVPVMLHTSMVRLTKVYEELGYELPAWRVFKADEAAGHALIFPPSAARSLVVKKLKVCRTAMLSGWALTPGARFRYQVDEVFPLSDHADYGELWNCVEQVQPKLIYTVHGSTREFARDLRERGHEAWSLIASDQLELGFETVGIKEVESQGPAKEERKESEWAVDAFAAWAMVSERVAAQSSRLKKQELLAEYLRKVPEQEVERVVRWFAAILDDPTLQVPPLHTGWATIKQALLGVSGLREAEYRQIARSQNDTGRTAFLVLQRMAESMPSGGVTLGEVAELFVSLREAQGPVAKAEVLKVALRSMSALEGSYVVRLLTGELRIGSREGLVEEAVAKAFEVGTNEVREASMLSGDIGRAARLAREDRLEEAQPELFVPVKVMLASPEDTAEDIWARLGDGGSVWLEDKFDGIRAQVHVGRGRVEIYTRDLKQVTEQFPEIAVASLELGGRDEVIVDGEIIAFADDKKLTFHDLQRRLGRKSQGDLFVPSDITVKYVVFDLMWRNGVSWLREGLVKRRGQLDDLVLPPLWQRIALLQADSPQAVEEAFHAARRSGNEGLIAKDRNSFYTPGRRGKTWLKLKKAFSTLDVVVVKAEQGHGKRSHVLSDYTFAVRDERGALRVIGKAYSGLTDTEIEELTEVFVEETIQQRGNVRTVTPRVVLEIAFDSIQESKRHDSGLALRFPRIKAIRRDKGPEEIDSLQYARKLAGVG